ncbi:hypothetical protein TNCT_205241 [Trichonephila clavata]|uniref:Uncharacterized protein n=1 Tax=Trichonephila clavata TaxID=2740835 RepID=A0A8X6H411_TRICU|nr:hypothetical protein TNCT_205241 [Trichonephila clavata]
MRSGDLFLEVSSSKQATDLIKLQKLAHLDITVAPHTNLNFSRGVISPAEFLNVSTEEILENMKAQKVCGVRRIMIRRDVWYGYATVDVKVFLGPPPSRDATTDVDTVN